MQNIFNLLDQGQKSLEEALSAGLIPFSLISAGIKFCEQQNEPSFNLLHLKQELLNGNFDPSSDTNSSNKDAMVLVINHLCEQYSDRILSLKELKLTGLQVEVEFYKVSGKYAYGGLVSLGEDVSPFGENLLDKIREAQAIVSSSDFSHFTVVVRDTTVNHLDRNYSYCMNRIVPT